MGLVKALKISLLVLLLPYQMMAAPKTEPEAAPGEYVVKIKSNERILNTKALSKSLGATIKSQISGTQFVVVQKPLIQTRASVISQLLETGLVEYAEPNFIYKTQATPNDPSFGNLWGMKNSKYSGIDISAEQAWDITTGSDDILVAVIDTGIDYNHSDLKANVWTNAAELNGKPDIDDDGNGIVDDIHGANFSGTAPTGNPFDDNSHGTHCSGTIGGSGNNEVGVAGVNWKTKIMAVKFLSASGSGSLEGAVKAIKYAVDNGAKVLSNSWGGGGFSQALKDIIQYSSDKGALFIAAAGNSSANNDSSEAYPANYDTPNMIAVAAIGENGSLASFSSYGKKKVHLAAPGVNILSTIPNEKYAQYSGTSMATPHVSGVAALVWGHEPNLTAIEVKERLLKTVTPLATVKSKTVTGGLVNALNALMDKQAPPDENDPDNWEAKTVSYSSPHPYLKNSKVEFEINVQGAKEFALYFSKFETETNYDFVKLYTKEGIEIGKMTGLNDGNYSQIVTGDYVKIVLTSDDSVEKYGFDITKIAFR